MPDDDASSDEVLHWFSEGQGNPANDKVVQILMVSFLPMGFQASIEISSESGRSG